MDGEGICAFLDEMCAVSLPGSSARPCEAIVENIISAIHLSNGPVFNH